MFPLQFKNYFWFELTKPQEDEQLEGLSPEFSMSLTSADWNKMDKKTKASLSKLLKEYMNKN